MKSITKRIISTLVICGALVLEAGATAFSTIGKGIARKTDATSYVEIATFNFLDVCKTGTSSSGIDASGIKTLLNSASSVSNLVTSVTNKTGDVYDGKGSGGEGVPNNILKIGKASGAGGFTFTIGGTDNISKLSFVGYGWKTATALSVNDCAAQSPSTALTKVTFDYVLSTATKTITVSSKSSAFCCESLTLYKEDAPAKTLTGVRLASEGSVKKTYDVGQSFNPSGLTIYASWDSVEDTSTNVASDIVWSPNPLTEGTTQVTGYHSNDSTKSYPIVISGISVLSPDYSLTYSKKPFSKSTNTGTDSEQVDVDGITYENVGGLYYSSEKVLEFYKSTVPSYLSNIDSYGKYISKIVIKNVVQGSKVKMYEGSTPKQEKTEISPIIDETTYSYIFSGNNEFFTLKQTTSNSNYFKFTDIDIFLGDNVRIPATGISISSSDFEISNKIVSLPMGAVGSFATGDLTASVTPSDASDKTVSWETSDSIKAPVVDGSVSIDTSAVGEYTITAYANGASTTKSVFDSVTFNVYDATTPTLTSVIVGGTPVTPQYAGKQLNYTGLTFTPVYDKVVEDADKDVIDPSKLSWSTLEVGVAPTALYTSEKYNGTVTITVSSLSPIADYVTDIRIAGNLNKTTYFNTDSWSTDGIYVEGHYASNPSEYTFISEDINYSFDPLKPEIGVESVAITATLGETDITATKNFDVTVEEKQYASGIVDGGKYIIEATFKPTDATNKVGPFVLSQGQYSAAPAGVLGTGEDFKNDITKAWTFTSTGADDEWYIHYTNESNDEIYLYHTANNDGVRSNTEATADNNGWKFKATLVNDEKLVLNLKDTKNSRYLTAYSKPDFRCYTSTTSQGAGSATITLTPYVEPATYESLEVTATKTSGWKVGDEPSLEDLGATVEAVYSDGNSIDVTEDATITDGLPLTKGDNTVTVSYTEESTSTTHTNTITVTAVQPVTSISMNTYSGQMNFSGTQELSVSIGPDDANDKSVTWESSNSSIATVVVDSTDSLKATVTAGTTVGDVKITAKTKDGTNLSATANIHVNDPTSHVTGITISGTLEKSEYFEGNEFDPSGLSVITTVSSGSGTDVINDVEWTPSPLEYGTTEVTATYVCADGTFTDTLSGIVVNHNTMTKLNVSYTGGSPVLGKDFEFVGSITASWADPESDDTDVELDDVEIGAVDKYTTDEQTITVTHLETGVTGTFKVTYVPKELPTTISWERCDSASDLLAGGTFIIGYEATAKSGVLIPMMNSGSATTSNLGYMYSGGSDGGTDTITMSTVTDTKNYEVIMGASSTVDGDAFIKIGENYLGNTNTKNNCKLFEEESANTAFHITVGNNDVFTLEITANTGATDNYKYLRYNTGSPRFAVYKSGQKDVVIYKKVVTKDPAELIKFEAADNGKTKYAGHSVSVDDFNISALFNDGTTEFDENLISFNKETYEEGSNTITITYGNYESLSVDVDVEAVAVEATGIEVTGGPTKTEYIEGQAFDPAGLKIKVTYNDGNEEVVEYDDTTAGDFSFDKDTLALGDTTVTVTYAGQTDDISVTVKAKSITGIAIDTNPDKVDYIEGETFNPAGLVITVSYDNGDTENVEYNDTTKASFSFSLEILALGDTKVTVTYAEKTADIEITVSPKSVSEISIKTEPTTTDYIEGQAFDPTGLVIHVKYDNGEETDVAYSDSTKSLFSFSPETLALGDTKVTVTFGGKSADVAVSVTEKSITGISVATNPTKVDYIEGNTFDPSGLVITVTYDNGKTENVAYNETTKDLFSFSESGKLVLGTEKVVVTYAEKTADIAITVAAKSVTEISVKTDPSKVEYVEGNAFDPTGLVIHVKYNNGDEEDIAYNDTTKASFSFSLETLSLGDTKVTVTYAEKTADIEITVSPKSVSEISIKTEPTTTDYIEGQAFNASGLVIHVKYDNGNEADVAYGESVKNLFSFSPETLALGDTKVTVTFGGKSADISVTVVAKSVTEIAIQTNPTKVDYIEGNVFDPAGLVITVTYDNGDTENVAYNETTKELFSFSVTDKLVLGTTNVVVTYAEKTADIAITVAAKSVTEIAVTTNPGKTEYVEGQAFDATGLVIHVKYDNGDEADVTYSDSTKASFAFDPETLALGDTSVTVTYGGKTASISVTVAAKAVSEISVGTNPDKVDYLEGEEFDPAGLVIHVVYNNGDEDDVTYSDSTKALFAFDPETLALGDTSVTVTYGGKTASISVTVTAKSVTEIAVATNPDKTEYIEGEEFNPAGLIITVTYDNGDTENVEYNDSTKASFSFSVTGKLVLGTDKVVVTYAGKTADIAITVNAKALESISVEPTSINIDYGTSINIEDLTVTATYSGESTVTVTDFTLGEYDSKAPGTQTVTITYQGKTCELTVIVANPVVDHIEVVEGSYATTVEQGDTYTFGGKINVYYVNGGEEPVEVTSGFEVSTIDTSSVGAKTLTVTYGGKTASVTITVVAKPVQPTVTELVVTDYTNKIEVGGTYTFDGIVVAKYSDGTEETLEASQYTVSVLDTSTEGEKTVTITFGDKTKDITVTVYKPVQPTPQDPPMSTGAKVGIGVGAAAGSIGLAVGLFFLIKLFKLKK